MIDLDNGLIRLRIDPEQGACMRQLETMISSLWQPVCVPGADPLSAMVAGDSAMFVMIPFANRARDNILIDGTRIWPVEANTDEPLALHGVGWQRSWKIARQSNEGCALSLCVEDGFPYTFTATYRIKLEAQSVRFSIELENTGDTDIPVGMGFHPYFPRRPSTTLVFDARHYWHEDDNHLPMTSSSFESFDHYQTNGTLPSGWQNTCFTGWNGLARIKQPELGYALTIRGSTGLSALMVYSSAELKRFAVEPQSHLSGCTTVSPNGLRRLEPGESTSEDMWLDVEPLT